MVHSEFFNYVFSSGALSGLLRAQTTSPEWLEYLDSLLQDTKYTKGQHLLNVGQTPDHIYFLVQGSVRAYYFDNKGNKQYTFYLWDEYSVVTDISNYVANAPSDLYIEVCEDAQMLALLRSSLDLVLYKYPESVLFLAGILHQYTQHHRERDMECQTMKADERLAKLLTKKRKLEQKFSRQWIASYLGMSRGWLYDIKGKDGH